MTCKTKPIFLVKMWTWFHGSVSNQWLLKKVGCMGLVEQRGMNMLFMETWQLASNCHFWQYKKRRRITEEVPDQWPHNQCPPFINFVFHSPALCLFSAYFMSHNSMVVSIFFSTGNPNTVSTMLFTFEPALASLLHHLRKLCPLRWGKKKNQRWILISAHSSPI